MDVFAHGFWAAALFRGLGLKVKRNFNLKAAVLWGVFPDVYSFTILFAWMGLVLVTGNGLLIPKLPHEGGVELNPDNHPLFLFTSQLYAFSHSFIIFFIVFFVASILLKRYPWELGAWFLHIFIDILTHSKEFYPTPFMWPLSSWTFGGISWANPWFLIPNYILILIAYYFIFYRKRKLLDREV